MLYAFGNQFCYSLTHPGPRAYGGEAEVNPNISFNLPAMKQLSDVEPEVNLFGGEPVEPIEVRDFIEPGFHYLDAGMKLYFGDIRIPTKDSVRFLRTKVAGMRRGIEAWQADLRHGRVRLPVISISRTTHTFNENKFSPPYHPMHRRYLNRDLSKVAKVFRPVPWLVEYTLTLWAETKRDAEYALHQIGTRFNPLAEFRVSDNHTVGTITLRPATITDQSDKEASSEQLAKVKYEITTSAEGWLSLPEQIVPTVLGIYGGITAGRDFEPWNRFNLGA